MLQVIAVDLSGLFELEGIYTGLLQVGIGLALIMVLFLAIVMAIGQVPVVGKILRRLRSQGS